MKLRHRHIDVDDALKTAIRERVAEVDDEGNAVRFESESYAPAHVHIIERADGSRIHVHNDDYPRLRALLDGPQRSIDEFGDPSEGDDSGAVYIKIDPRKESDNVTYQCPVSVASLARARVMDAA